MVEAAGGVVRGVAAVVDRTGGTAGLPAPLRALARVDAAAWQPTVCPLCAAGSAPVKPGSRSG